MILRLEAGTEKKNQIITSDEEKNRSDDQISSESSDSSEGISEKHARLIKRNKEINEETRNLRLEVGAVLDKMKKEIDEQIVMNIDERVMMNVRQEDGTRDRDQNNQVNSENITSSERRSEKYANLMRMNEEESIEWVNMKKIDHLEK